ncbi:MAG: hypothetical protein AAB596_02065 [Patescibacteria group bacterium]|mgnify:CR=1 FL=1
MDIRELFQNKGRFYFLLFSIGFLIFLTAIKALAVDQIKSTEFFVSSSESQISSATSTDFTIYIGDNLAGVSNPVKSAYFEVSGVYTGSGSLELKIDNDTATSKTFSLPNVGATPTPYEIIYKDDTNKINPSSAGSYNYTLNIIPTGITISGLGAEMKLTHRYVPPSCPDGQPTNEKIKSTEFFVSSSESQISSATSTDFTIYIGDNLAGVSNPVKSAYFEVSGVYTGSGSLELKIDNDTATSKTFSLPNVGATPTPYEIIYKDDTNKINPSSAGSYNYTLNIIPTGITISGLGAEMKLTHRYKPPNCGGGYPATGDLISLVFDTGIEGAAYNSVMFKGTKPVNTKVRFQFATSNNSGGPWSYIGGATCAVGDWYDVPNVDSPVEITCAPSSHNNQRYFRYKIQLCSASDCSSGGSDTPSVTDVVVSWSP